MLSYRREEKRKSEAKARKQHHTVVTTRRGAEKHDLQVELTVLEGRERRKQEVKQASVVDVLGGIDAFESILTRLGTESLGTGRDGEAPGTGKDLSGTETGGLGATGTIGQSPLDTIRQIRTMAPDLGTLAKQSEAYLATIRAKRKEELGARREREARRMKVLVEQQKALDETQHGEALEVLRESLQKRSDEERLLVERLDHVSLEEEVLRENRALREGQYEERRVKDHLEALHREFMALRSMQEGYDAGARAQMGLLLEAEDEARRERAAEVEAACREAALGLVGIAERAGEYRARLDAMVPRAEYRKWVTMFIHGDPDILARMPSAAPPAASDHENDGMLQLLGSAAVEDYLAARGEWEGAPTGSAHPVLCETVGSVFGKAEMEAAAGPALPGAAALPIRLAVTGAPFSGKTTLAWGVAKIFKLRVIEPQSLLKQAVEAAQSYDPVAAPSGQEPEGSEAPEAEAAAAEVPLLVQLGQEALEVLAEGGAVPDDLMTRLVLRALEETAGMACQDPLDIEGMVQAARESAGTAKDKKADKKGGCSRGPIAAILPLLHPESSTGTLPIPSQRLPSPPARTRRAEQPPRTPRPPRQSTTALSWTDSPPRSRKPLPWRRHSWASTSPRRSCS